MKTMKLRFMLAASAFAGLMAAGGAARAQAWYDYRPWTVGPRIYEEAPPVIYGRGPQYMAPDALPRAVVRRIMERRGYGVIGQIQLSGDVYVVPVEDSRGRTLRVVVDAASGELVERIPMQGPPRPPANMGRTRDRYAATPESIDPYERDMRPAQPRGVWPDDGYAMPVPPPAVNERERRARERFARQTPDEASGPRGRMEDFDAPPALRPGQAAPAPRAAEPRREPAPRRSTTHEQKKPQPKQQAARTPPEAQKPAPAATAPAPVEAARPVDPPKSEAAKPAPVKPEVARTPEPNTTVVAPSPKPETRKPEPSGNASVLRRPSQKADEAKPGERKGIAEAPAGPEPQRKAPRVVYPGPGAPAPTPSAE